MLSKLMVLLVTIGLLISCSQADINPLQQEVIGSWKWVETSGGIAGINIKATSSENVVVTFKKNGTFELSENDQIKVKTTYEVKAGKSILTNDTKAIISYGESGMISQTFQLKAETLYLNDEVFDGFGHTYVKIN